MFTRPRKFGIFLYFSIFLLSANALLAQTEFTYQGSLKDGGQPANNNYDFEFRLFGTLSGGTTLATQQRLGVPVGGGVFTVQLDFGSNFPGAQRYLEIGVKPAGSPNAFTTLTPRQLFTSTPYAIRSLNASVADTATNATNATNAANASQLGGIAAGQYVLTTDARMTDARAPTAGSTNYIQNTRLIQTNADFNISGNGTAGGTLSAAYINATQYNIGGNRILSIPGTQNLFAGVNAGLANTIGNNNSFFGNGAGAVNTTGQQNSFFGSHAGLGNNSGEKNSFFGNTAGFTNLTGTENSFFGWTAGYTNTVGNYNSFFGSQAGRTNTIGIANSFFGRSAGQANTEGSGNSFFGYFAGGSNVDGQSNSFFGYNAGQASTSNDNSFFGYWAGIYNTTGTQNTFLGTAAGTGNTTGSNNTLIGHNANMPAGNLGNATAIGAGAFVSQSNSLVLGNNANVGIGTSSPKAKLDVRGGSVFIAQPNSLIITSPNGACWFITVNNSGILSTISVPCPN